VRAARDDADPPDEYTFLLFYNVFWTLLPVIFMGLFDQRIQQDIAMNVPELYRYGIRGSFFGLKRFAWYMIDGIYQGAVCFFFLCYTCACSPLTTS